MTHGMMAAMEETNMATHGMVPPERPMLRKILAMDSFAGLGKKTVQTIERIEACCVHEDGTLPGENPEFLEHGLCGSCLKDLKTLHPMFQGMYKLYEQQFDITGKWRIK